MQTMSVWPETGTPARWRSPEPRAVNGSPFGDRTAPFRCDSFGGPREGFDTASFGTRVRVARGRPRLRASEVGGEQALHRYAGDRGRMERRARTTGAPLRGSALDRDKFSSGNRTRLRWNRAPSGATGRRGGSSLRGRAIGIPRILRGSTGCGRGASFGIRRSHTRPISSRSLRRCEGRDRKPRQPSGCRRAGTTGACLRARRPIIGRMEPDKAETLCLPQDCSGPGTPRGFAREAKRPAGLDGAQPRGSIGTCRLKAHGSIERVRSGNAAQTQRTPRWNKALRSAEWIARRGNTGADARGTTRRHANR